METIRLQLGTDRAGRVTVETPAEVKKTKPVVTVREGDISIPIFAQTLKGKKRRYRSHFFSWSDGTGRHRVRRASLAKAKQLAKDKALSILGGRVFTASLDEREVAELIAARDHWKKLPDSRRGLSFESYVAKAVTVCLALPGDMALEAVPKFVDDYRPAGVVLKDVPQIVEELLGDLKQAGAGERWRESLGGMLKRFAEHWTGPLHIFRSADANAWLRGLKDKKGKPVGPHTRKNYRAALIQLETFAKANGYLLKSWSELSTVKAPVLVESEIKTILPRDLVKLLAKARPSIIPFIACTAFAGIRHEEMVPLKNAPRLDWRNVNLERRNIYVPKDVGKEGNRNVPISDNLAAWLAKHYLPSGPVCALKNAADPLLIAKRKAGIPASRNESRNTLRKSFITYRLALTRSIEQVADEAGNSAAMIESNYKGALEMPDDLASEWFNIFPSSSAIRQLNFAGL